MRKFFITVAVDVVVVVVVSIDGFAAIIIIIIIVVIVVVVVAVVAEVVVRTDRVVVSACGGHWQHCFRTESVVGLVGFTSMFSRFGLITLPSGGSRICFCDTIR